MRPLNLVVLAGLLLIPIPASADFTADYQGLTYGTGLGTLTIHTNGQTVETTYACQFNWAGVPGTGSAPVSNSFTTFCIDIVQTIHDPTRFTPADLASAPVGGSNPNGGMGAAAAALIQELYDRFYTQVTSATTAA